MSTCGNNTSTVLHLTPPCFSDSPNDAKHRIATYHLGYLAFGRFLSRTVPLKVTDWALRNTHTHTHTQGKDKITHSIWGLLKIHRVCDAS